MKAGPASASATRTIALIRQAVAMKQWRLTHGESYLVTGEPAIVADLTGSITRSIELLLVAVVLVMALALSLIFRGRPRLLPLGMALLAAALTFGALALVGASLTVAQVAVLPVLVGLAVDYAIQFQSRVGEDRSRARGHPTRRRARGARAGRAGGAPTIATAVAASAAAMLALVLSPVPMVRGFGLLLVVGIAIAFLCALIVGSAALVAGVRAARARAPWPAAQAGRRASSLSARELLACRMAGSARAAAGQPADTLRIAHRARSAVRRPGRVLGVGLALAVLGWGLDTQTQVQTDITKLVPQNMASLRNLDTLERASGWAAKST